MASPSYREPFFGAGLLARAFEGSPDAVEIDDTEGAALYVNDAWRSLFQSHGCDATGVMLDAHSTGKPPAIDMKLALEECLSRGSSQGAFRLRRPDGSEVVISHSCSLYRNADGAPTAVIKIYRPLPEGSSLELGRFEHAMRNVFAVIGANLQLVMERASVDEMSRRRLDLIQEAVKNGMDMLGRKKQTSEQ